MIKYFCDCCKKEVKRLHSFSFQCHLNPNYPRIDYVDGEMNAISGREDSLELCSCCYNKIVSRAISEYNTLKL